MRTAVRRSRRQRQGEPGSHPKRFVDCPKTHQSVPPSRVASALTQWQKGTSTRMGWKWEKPFSADAWTMLETPFFGVTGRGSSTAGNSNIWANGEGVFQPIWRSGPYSKPLFFSASALASKQNQKMAFDFSRASGAPFMGSSEWAEGECFCGFRVADLNAERKPVRSTRREPAGFSYLE